MDFKTSLRKPSKNTTATFDLSNGKDQAIGLIIGRKSKIESIKVFNNPYRFIPQE